ncbi:ABC transporter permease [Spirochaeta isovalerica]|uniref:ABC-2 type transport system permease protein n=1 Tax=Spirochaeta isovalerica TaxID=150 RepID=A0A841R768_9SPIO|nr:ABC-2 family transporter protein [Spirochaeta isovalerica]MBB6479676.1 ABC-2 type transport system permease protein [Spirochaeta isovalerica]
MKKYFLFNLSAGMEYRTSFLIQVFGMVLNNCAFIIFWKMLFDRVGGDINGYGFREVMFLWALATFGFSISEILMGNARQLSSIIYKGELDVYLLQPRAVLPNLVCSRMNISGWGDLIYGVALFVITQPLTPVRIVLFLLFALMMALVFVSVRVFYHSLTFFLGNAEQFAATISELVIMFTIYPGSIFSGPSTWILHTIIPAALVAWIPAQLFASFDPLKFLMLLAADGVIVLLSLFMFREGLKRYSSGNRMGTRL